jgi:inhibitor of KinA sporulation pathway (predicted exonuclease)
MKSKTTQTSQITQTPSTSIRKDYAVVYRSKDDNNLGKLVRERGLTFTQAEKRNKEVHGQIHKMSGVRSFKVS